MDHLKLFETQNEFINKESTLHYPCVSYVKDVKEVKYKEKDFMVASFEIDELFKENYKKYYPENTDMPFYSNEIGALDSYSLKKYVSQYEYSLSSSNIVNLEKTLLFEDIFIYAPTKNVENMNLHTEWSTTADVKENDFLTISLFLNGEYVNTEVFPIQEYLIATEQEKETFYVNISDDLKTMKVGKAMYEMLNSSGIGVVTFNCAFINFSSLENIENGTSTEAYLPSYETIVSTYDVIKTNTTLVNEEVYTFNENNLSPEIIALPIFNEDFKGEYEIILNFNKKTENVGGFASNMNYIMPINKIDFHNLSKRKKYTISTYFMTCASITEIDIPNSVENIEDRAFLFNPYLKTIKIGKSVKNIGEEVFANLSSSNLDTIIVSENNPYYDSRENCNAIIETATNTLILGCMNTIIPNTITKIGAGAFFYCTSLTSITIPDSVTIIDDSAFKYCSGLTSVTIGSGVNSISYSVFSECHNLNQITFKPYTMPSIVNYPPKPYETSNSLNTFYNISPNGTVRHPLNSEGYEKLSQDFTLKNWEIIAF